MLFDQHITTGAGNITITGTGKSATSGTASIGIDISNNSSLTTTSGNITLAGTGGTSGTAFTMGVSLFNGSTITTATGAISADGVHRDWGECSRRVRGS